MAYNREIRLEIVLVLVAICLSLLQSNSSLLRIFSKEISHREVSARKLEEKYQRQNSAKSSRRSKYRRVEGYFEGRVVSKPSRRVPGGIRIEAVGRIDDIENIRVLLSVPDLPWSETSSIRKGKILRGRGKFTLISEEKASPPSPWSYAGYLYRRGIVLRGRLDSPEVELGRSPGQTNQKKVFVKKLVAAHQGGDALAVVLAATIGERDLLSQFAKRLFQRTGTSHLLVVSGFHIGVVFLVVKALARLVVARSETVLLYVPIQITAPIIGLCAACSYSALSGATVSTVRACIAVSLFAIGEMLCRRPRNFRSIVLAYIIVILIWPGAFFEVGCQLTFAALVGLCLAHCLASRIATNQSYPIFLRTFLRGLIYSFGAWLFTAPIVLLRFGQLPLLAPITNAVFAPIFSAVCICFGGLIVLLSFLELPFSHELMQIELAVVRWLIDMLFYLEKVSLNVSWRN